MGREFPNFIELQQLPIYYGDVDIRRNVLIAAMNEAYSFHVEHCEAFCNVLQKQRL